MDNSLDIASEAHALKIEKEWKERYERYDNELEEHFLYIRKLFDENDTKAREILYREYLEKQDNSIYKSDQRHVNFYILLYIYGEELASGEERTILDCGSNYEELSYLLKIFRMLLFRLEFTGNENDALFADFVLSNGISKTCIERMVRFVNVDKYGIYRKLANIFFENNKLVYMLIMLKACDEIKPNIEENLLLMANIYKILGLEKLEKQCLDRIKN